MRDTRPSEKGTRPSGIWSHQMNVYVFRMVQGMFPLETAYSRFGMGR